MTAVTVTGTSTGMSTLAALSKAETRLFLRDPVTVVVAVLLPSVVLAGLGSIPLLREPFPAGDGLSFVTYFAPSLLVISIVQLGLQTLPGTLSTYRERGVLRRYAATPVSPLAVLVVQLLVNLATALLAVLLLLAVAVLALGVPAPRHPLDFALAVLLGTTAAFSLGLLIAAVAPRARTAGAIGGLAFMLTLFFAGTYLPAFLLPDTIVAIGAFVPPGVSAIKESWVGAGADPLVLAVMAATTVVASAAAARLFRWE